MVKFKRNKSDSSDAGSEQKKSRKKDKKKDTEVRTATILNIPPDSKSHTNIPQNSENTKSPTMKTKQLEMNTTISPSAIDNTVPVIPWGRATVEGTGNTEAEIIVQQTQQTSYFFRGPAAAALLAAQTGTQQGLDEMNQLLLNSLDQLEQRTEFLRKSKEQQIAELIATTPDERTDFFAHDYVLMQYRTTKNMNDEQKAKFFKDQK